MCDVGSKTETVAGGWLPGLLFLALETWIQPEAVGNLPA